MVHKMPRNPPNILPDDRIALRINDAVAVSGLSRSTLYKLHAEGKLRAVKVAGRRLILREDLQALLQGEAR
jgi:excisionase family DNA binding protein